jgi:hypothetical protein
MRKVAAVAALALALAGVPAAAAPQPPRISRGFYASGKAGSQVVVRLTDPLLIPSAFDRDAPLPKLSSSSGALRGFALRGRRNNHFGYAVETTPQWTCGASSCGREASLLDTFAWNGDGLGILPAGDYVLVLLGSPGATIDVSYPAYSTRPARIRTVKQALPTVTDAPSPTSLGLGVEPYGFGSYHIPQRAPKGFTGVVHLAKGEVNGGSTDYEYTAGTAATEEEACHGWWSAGSRSRNSLIEPAYVVNTLFSPVDGAYACGEWTGQVEGVLTEQRALGFYVPFVY